MGRKSLKEIRQQEIVKAFYKVAKKEGLANASIAKVASIMDINPSLIIHYFKTKNELLHALVKFNLKRYLSIYSINGIIDTKEKLIELIDNLFSRKWNRLFDDGLFYNLYSQIYRNNKFKNEFKVLHDSLHKNLEERLELLKEKDLIKIQNTKQTVAIIYALIDGAYYYLGMVSDKTEILNRTEWYKEHVKNILGIYS